MRVSVVMITDIARLPVNKPALMANRALPRVSPEASSYTQCMTCWNALEGGSASGSRRPVIPRSLFQSG